VSVFTCSMCTVCMLLLKIHIVKKGSEKVLCGFKD